MHSGATPSRCAAVPGMRSGQRRHTGCRLHVGFTATSADMRQVMQSHQGGGSQLVCKVLHRRAGR